jgi:phage tail sheath protein FI
MAFYLSPGVYTREIDLSTTIPAVSTNISVLVIRNAWKGTEFEKFLVSNDDQLVSLVGFPTNKSFIDIMTGAGFLKYGSMLYASIVRPDDATFAGIKIQNGYEDAGASFINNFTYNVTGSVNDGDEVYGYTNLGITDLKEFPAAVESDIDTPLWIISNWRGESANNIRVLVFNKDLFNAIKYHKSFDPEESENPHEFETPSTITLTQDAMAAAGNLYEDNSNAFYTIRNLSINLENAYQFGIVVEALDQGSTNWVQKEIFIVSTREDEKNDENELIFVNDHVNEQSQYIKVALNPDNINEEATFGTTNYVELEGGYDGEWGRHTGTDASDAEDAAVITAYEMYSDPEEIDVNLFIDGNKGLEVKRKLIEICQTIRKDCMAVLDVNRADVINNTGNEATALVRWRKITFNPNTSYSCCYGNWLEVFDKWNKRYRWIPASGHMAGLFANTDNVADAWWAPAGLNRAIITGVRRLAWNPNQGERDLLYQNGINPVCSFAGQGKVVWGQKTLLDKSSAFNRINVRRLFLVLSKAISKASKYFIFEQNDEITWMLMTNMIEPFLRDVKGRRGIYDFWVVINETNNTPERIDRNELWGDIYIQPTRSAEFIQLSFIATKTGANFEELIGVSG